MNIALIAAILVGVAALLGAWRTLRAATSHRALRVALQLAAAVLVYLALFPPLVDERFVAGTLVVLTPGVTPEQMASRVNAAATVALPGASSRSEIEKVPDLGTALRRHPDTARLRVIGGGLPPRDLDAARTLPIDFDAAVPPNGIVYLSSPARVRAGSTFAISGRVQGDIGGRVELRDPAVAVVARAALADDGAFTLKAQARTAGNVTFALRVLDSSGAQVEEVTQPIAVLPGDGLHVLVLAGAPDPELKYLRRWATDSGVDLASRIVLSDGIAMLDDGATLTAETLAGTDLVIVDERAWKALDANAKTLLKNAARSGLGLFLRVTGTLPEDVAADWGELGFRVRAADVAQAVSLEQNAGAPDPAAVLSRRALIVDADDATPLLRGSDGSAVALWRSEGLGRVAIWWLGDTYRIALAGDAAQFGTLWSRALATVGRARAAAPLDIPDDSRVDQRSVLCGLADGSFVEQPDGTHAALTIETPDEDRRCAAYWPAQEGWHTLVSADRRAAFHAGATNATPSLVAARNANATRGLAGSLPDSGSSTATRGIPAPRWPFFLVWLAAVVVLWWLERTKARVAES
jgi:hypothetical protein